MMSTGKNDISHNIDIYIKSIIKNNTEHTILNITNNNIYYISVYYAVRKVIEMTWMNNKDNYMKPNEKYKNDEQFVTNCFVFTLFNNNISTKEGTNHWIPFTEKEVNAKGKFESHFMSDLIAGKAKIKKDKELFDEDDSQEKGKLVLSKEAQEVFNAGKEIWKYYHSFSRVNVNASFYDIKLHFQESTNGRMNNKSTDEEYNVLIGTLREKLKILAKKIEPKIYKYGFLLK